MKQDSSRNRSIREKYNMKLDKIYIGGWFQRTTLQLSEVYDFVREGTSQLKLDQKKLNKLHKELNIKDVNYKIDGLEYILINTNDEVNIKIFEDGLIVLNDENVNEFSLLSDLDNLAKYYETKLSPAINYLFSLGAPVPKELANIKTVYPYFIVLNNESKENIATLLNKTEREKYFEFENDSYDVIRGNKYYFINSKTKDSASVERYVEEQIFIREFKAQLHRYLNLHRIIWEKIDAVKENVKVRGKDIVAFSSKIDGYRKTVNLIDSRINQMNTYISTREKIAKSDENLSESLALIGYRYETLKNTVSYMQQIWSMTKNYLSSADSLFKGLENQITSKSVNNLTIVTSMGVGASLLGLFTKSEPMFTSFGFVYFFILAFVGYSVNKIMSFISSNRKYEISDIEYDKNIDK